MTLALFILEPIGVNGAMEAVHCLRFCSERCRSECAQKQTDTIALGTDEDWVDGTVCDVCAIPLIR